MARWLHEMCTAILTNTLLKVDVCVVFENELRGKKNPA